MRRSMPVRTPGKEKAGIPCALLDLHQTIGEHPGAVDFNALETRFDETGKKIVEVPDRGVRPDGNPPCIPDHPDRSRRIEKPDRHIGVGEVSDVLNKGFIDG